MASKPSRWLLVPVALVALAFSAIAARAASNQVPTTNYSGFLGPLKPADTLVDSSGHPFGLMVGSFTPGDCLEAGSSAKDIVDALAACGAGAGTVTSVSSANGDLTVGSPTTTPLLTVISAPKWDTARTLSFTGDATGSGSVDGSANVATALRPLKNHGCRAQELCTNTNVTFDAHGRDARRLL